MIDLLLKTGRDLSTISGRMNALLDISEQFSSSRNERVKELVDKFGASRTAAYKWLGDNIVPRQQAFLQIVEFCLLQVQSNLKAKTVMAWIEYGDAIPSIFHESGSVEESLSFDDVGHAIRSILAESQRLNITNLDQILSESSFQQLLKDVLENLAANKKLDTHFVSTLLKAKLKEALKDKLA